MTTPVLSAKNLTTQILINQHIYPIVENISFDLYPGKTLALVGESGCGKSLTALSIMRILPHPPILLPTGEVLYRQQNLLRLAEKEMRTIRGGKIAMVFQDPFSALNPVYTIGNQLVEVAELHLGLYGEEALAKVTQTLQDVGIPSAEARLDDYPHQLSGGMRQRVMIAMALICEPDILIADEPTTALDVTIQAQVLDLIRNLQKKKNTAVLLITHDMGIVAEMADEVIVMYAGEGVERGSVYQLFDEMAHPYTVGLFRSRPSLGRAKEPLTPIKGVVPMLTKYPKGCRFHPRCPYAMAKCGEGKVHEYTLSNGHLTKCWLYDETAESKEKLDDATSHIRRKS